MGENNCSLSAIIPAHNEELDLEAMVQRTRETFQQSGVDAEIIIVNDCSTDATGAIADRLAAACPDVLAYHHPVNRGAGQAFKTGLQYAQKEYVMFVPVDNPLDTEDLQAYLPRMPWCDVIVGVRVERVGYPPLGRFASFMYNRIFVPLLFNIGVADVNWIQAYRRSLFTEGVLSFEDTRIFFLVEILVRARMNRLIIGEVPAVMKKRLHGKPTCLKPAVISRTFFDMLRFWRQVYLKENRL